MIDERYSEKLFTTVIQKGIHKRSSKIGSQTLLKSWPTDVTQRVIQYDKKY